MVIISKIICRMAGKNCASITLFPFIFMRSKAVKSIDVIINHEKIHLKQQIELLVIFFYPWYLIEFLIRYISHKEYSRYDAYIHISFEQEAHYGQYSPTYLKFRKLWSFMYYI